MRSKHVGLVLLASATAVAATSAFLPTGSAAPAGAAALRIGPRPAIAGHLRTVDATAPSSTADCQDRYGSDCYGPAQYRAAYDLQPLYDQGIDGSGRTIVIVDSFGSPTVQHDLEVFDRQYGLPDTQVEVVKWGDVPTFDPKVKDQVEWAGETTLDVEYAHAVAPGAHLLLVETGTSEAEGTAGFPEMMDAVKSLAAQGRGDVVSFSLGATEDSFAEEAGRPGDYHLLNDLRYGLQAADAQQTTVLAAAGDAGATDRKLDGKTFFPNPQVGWPASDPLVTAVGGTRMYLDDDGNRLQPDEVWNDGDGGATGGGTSRVFARPSYQDGVAGVTGDHRGLPDISMSASPKGGAWIYGSYDPAHTGWEVTGGTSQATPMMAGITAMADQAAGTRLGALGPRLYQLAQTQDADHPHGIVDVTSGDNSANGVTGYQAGPGYNLATGWGTLDGYQLVKSLSGRDDL
ncbi:S53 family peptidase [Kitasatospora viridis]|uniref:Subtilase family protein n=1 Tax=Kitasatospora viridis TaxID=281105 RepID=A0A561S9K1_9ACTN|nr:S53 family peptidase [Kitasatospora viridis]TWF71552.1 subtilase family protein [Kitasatospora viridis]